MESQERTAAVSASRRIKVNWNLTYTPNSIAIPGQLLSGVRIPRMRGTAERQALPPAFMRGEGHAVAGGVPRSGGESLLSHGFAVPAPPEGKPRGLRPHNRSFRAGYQTGVRISRMKGAVYRFAPQIPPVKNVFRNRKYLLSPGGCDMICFIIVKCP